MMWLDRIFDVFSRRTTAPSQNSVTTIPDTFRNRIFLWTQEVFGNKRSSVMYFNSGSGENCTVAFWQEIHRRLQYRHGKVRLSDIQTSSIIEEALLFIQTSSTEIFLDFLEDIFHVGCLSRLNLSPKELVEEINHFLKIDNLPYHLTDYLTETEKTKLHGQTCDVIRVVSFPRIVCRDSEVVYSQAILPTLTFLQDPAFKLANSEFLNALTDYRKDDYGDCLTKCGSAFESVLKITCDNNNWTYDQKDTSSKLIKIFLNKTALDTYYETFLTLIPTLRNRLSSSHGAGVVNKTIPQYIAQFAINITAASILLVANQTKRGIK